MLDPRLAPCVENVCVCGLDLSKCLWSSLSGPYSGKFLSCPPWRFGGISTISLPASQCFHTFQGCTKGLHNPTKPPEPEKKKEKPMAVGEVDVNAYVIQMFGVCICEC